MAGITGGLFILGAAIGSVFTLYKMRRLEQPAIPLSLVVKP
jgi:HAMP domain-containing protein